MDYILIMMTICDRSRSNHVDIHQRHVAGVARLGGGEVRQARDGLQRDHGRAVVDRGHDGPG